MMFSKKSAPKNAVVETTSTPTPALTSGQWQQRVTDLETQAAEARQSLEQKRAARSEAAGQVIVFGGPDTVSELVEEERAMERAAENLDSAVVLAIGELEKALAEEDRARREERARQRDEIAAQILHHSRLADAALASVAENVLLLPELFRQYNHFGGGMQPRINVSFTRALRGADLKKFVMDDLAVYNIHALPLATQFQSNAPKPNGESAEETPESLSA